MGLCPKPRGLYQYDTKKGNKKKRHDYLLKILLPFLFIITSLLLVTSQFCHIPSSDNFIVYCLVIIVILETVTFSLKIDHLLM